MHRSCLFPVIVALLTVIVPANARAQNSGLDFEGLVQVDSAQASGDAVGISDDTELRRAELVLKGGAERWDWVLGYDVSERNDKWLDAGVRFRFGSNWRWSVGQFKQPNSLEELSSTRHNDFLTKAMVTSTFGLGRRLGIAVAWSGQRWLLAASGFGREWSEGGGRGAGQGMRAVWTPLRQDGHIVHLALSGIRRETDGARLRARVGVDLSSTPRLIDTGLLADAEHIRTMGLETGWVHGPFKLQGEFMQATVARSDAPSFRGKGGYVSAVWNLTGETWGHRGGVFTTTASPGRASGLWQVAARAERMDLRDGHIHGGRASVLSVGVNWYWRQHVKLMLNHSRSDVVRPSGSEPSISAVSARAQWHW